MNCPTCNEHIDEHPASRCLDAWVAVDVMGWEWEPFWPEGTNTVGKWHHETKEDYTGNPSHYSTDIAVAWPVLEKLNTVVEVLLDGGGYSVRIGFAPGHIHRGYADEAPLAICRAAIKAVQG